MKSVIVLLIAIALFDVSIQLATAHPTKDGAEAKPRQQVYVPQEVIDKAVANYRAKAYPQYKPAAPVLYVLDFDGEAPTTTNCFVNNESVHIKNAKALLLCLDQVLTYYKA